MAAIANVLSHLKSEFENAKNGLKSVDDSIRRLTGREPGVNRGKGIRRNVNQLINEGDEELEDGEIVTDEPVKKRRFIGSAFSRVHIENSRRQQIVADVDDKEEVQKKPTLQSSVIATQREVKPRHQAIEEQKSDQKSMARNKRMFGMILGTLQKFQSEESRRKETTQKRVEIEKKLEQAAEDEKELIKKERKELYKVRREKQAQIRRIELKMERVQIVRKFIFLLRFTPFLTKKQHQEWEKSHQFLGGFIQTKTKPHIFYMPIKHLPETEKRLKETKDKYRLIVAEKRAKVQKELSEIDELYKKEEIEESEDVMMEVKENNGPNNEVDVDSVGNSVEGETTEAIVKSEPSELNCNKEINEDNVPKDVESSDIGDKEFEPIYDE
ncbi:pinin-like protein [Dinothrombium tinctorium]|uniref:Pinin n=1 Tax=Dinothrombium tinctorium TaxID=1965070 RepID=A0A443QMR5_9ACAR|nr:pinin-like protein [Dinothrombium tinctorium]